jgi:hypothetical protein
MTGALGGAAGSGTGTDTARRSIDGGAGGSGGGIGAAAAMTTGAELCHRSGLYSSDNPGRPAATQRAAAHTVAISAIQSHHRGVMTYFQAVASVTLVYHAAVPPR